MALGFASPAVGILLGSAAAWTDGFSFPGLQRRVGALRASCLPSVQAGLAADSHRWQRREELKPSDHKTGWAARKKRHCEEFPAWEENNPDVRAAPSTLKWLTWSRGFEPGAGKPQMHPLRATQALLHTTSAPLRLECTAGTWPVREKQGVRREAIQGGEHGIQNGKKTLI